MPQPSESVKRFNLLGGEDTYASQSAQNPQTARRLAGLIPSYAGYLEREKAHPKLALSPSDTAPVALSGPIGWIFQAYFADPATGVHVNFILAATKSPDFGLYVLTTGSPDTWVKLLTISAIPQAVIINNKLLLSDGVNSWTIVPDPTFSTLTAVTEGFPIPQHAPSFSVGTGNASSADTSITRVNGVTTLVLATGILPSLNGAVLNVSIAGESDTSFNGTFELTTSAGGFTTGTIQQSGLPDSSGSTGGTTTLTGTTIISTRYYWTTWVDQTGEQSGVSRAHESDSSPRSLGTGPTTNQNILVNARPGTVVVTLGSNAVVGSGTDFDKNDVGLVLIAERISNYQTVGVIQSVTDSQHLTLALNATFNASSAYNIAPSRATGWKLYASESESSNIGYLLAELPLTGSSHFTFSPAFYIDQSLFQGGVDSPFNGNTVQRPYRCDPPPPSTISTLHKRRNFHRRETKPNFFLFSGYEEVLQFGGEEAAEESYPGCASNTISDIINETSFPDQSREIRNIVSHGDAAFIFSEKNAYALYGESISDFSLTQATAFSQGCAGRYASVSTPHGLAFVSYDGKVYLYPTQFVFWAVLGDATSALIELSKPKRVTFQAMNLSNPDSISLTFYNFGKRDWLILNFQDTSNAQQTWVYDFEIQGWFQYATTLSISSLTVIEPLDNGYKVLVGGDTSGNAYILDDVTGAWTSNTAQPAGLFRPALCDFGRPDMNHTVKYVEFEVSNPAMNVTVNWYKDPIDADSPVNPKTLNRQTCTVGAGKFRCFPKELGTLCNRALFEFNVASDNNDGVIRSISVYAEMAAAVIG